jgi:hypothetical protein
VGGRYLDVLAFTSCALIAYAAGARPPYLPRLRRLRSGTLALVRLRRRRP